jgi:hypothetical protein
MLEPVEGGKGLSAALAAAIEGSEEMHRGGACRSSGGVSRTLPSLLLVMVSVWYREMGAWGCHDAALPEHTELSTE